MAKSPTILPCPFCGGPAKVRRYQESLPEIPKVYYGVLCPSKNACSVWPDAFGDTRNEAIEKWNTRAGIMPIKHRLACPDCDANVGQPHLEGCDVERCSVCGGQRLACSCKGHDRAFARWTGFWPGETEALALGISLNDLHTFGIDKVLFVKPGVKDTTVNRKIYSGRPCNHIVRCPETGEAIKDIKAQLGSGKPARMPTLAAAESAARWVSELTGRTFVAEEVRHG